MTKDIDYIPTAVAFSIVGESKKGCEATKATALFNNLMGEVTRNCVQSGSWMIGHVKAALNSDAGFISISSTTDDGKVRNRGELKGTMHHFDFTANVIVYGLNEDQVTDIFQKEAAKVLPNSIVEVIVDPGCEDPGCQDPLCRDPGHRTPIIPLG